MLPVVVVYNNDLESSTKLLLSLILYPISSEYKDKALLSLSRSRLVSSFDKLKAKSKPGACR